MEKTLSYSIAEYLPFPFIPRDQNSRLYTDVSGGKVWEAARDFHSAGVSKDLVECLVIWGIAYNGRAAAIQYH